PLAKKGIATALIVLMAVINVRGTRESASVQNTATGIKVAAILIMSAILFALGDGGGGAPAPTPAPASAVTGATLSGVGLSIIAVLWAYEGWQYVTFAVGESTDPQRAFPKAIILGTATLIIIYLVANFAYLAALGPARVAASERV